MVSNYIIPSEYQMLETLSRNSGVAITWSCNAKQFIEDEKLQLLWESDQLPDVDVFLLSAKNNNLNSLFEIISTELKAVLR